MIQKYFIMSHRPDTRNGVRCFERLTTEQRRVTSAMRYFYHFIKPETFSSYPS